MAFDATAFKTKLSTSLGIQPPTPPKTVPVTTSTPAAAPVAKAPTLSSYLPKLPAPNLPVKTSTPATPIGTDTAGAVKKGIQILNPMQSVKLRPLFAKEGETETLPFGGPVIGAAHNLIARTIEAVPNIALRTAANYQEGLSGGKAPPLTVPFDVSRIGLESEPGSHTVTTSGANLVSKFDEFKKSNPGQTKSNIAIAVLGGPVTDALNAFVVGDLLTSAAKAILKATNYNPELNWALDTYGIKDSGLTGEDFAKELASRFKKKATALARENDVEGMNRLGQATHVIMEHLTGRGVPTLNRIGTILENASRTGLQDAKYGFHLEDPRYSEVAAETPMTPQTTLPGYMEEAGQAPAFGMSTRRTTRVGGETPETPVSEAPPPNPFKGFLTLSTKTLEKLRGKTTVSKQFISDLTNAADIKQPEKDLLRAMLEHEGTQINVDDFAHKVKAELLPLDRTQAEDLGGNPTSKYENVSLHPDVRGPVADYSEHIYESPIKTSAGEVHFGDGGFGLDDEGSTKNYFGHTRVEDLPALDQVESSKTKGGLDIYKPKIDDGSGEWPKGTVRRVIEVQSDLYQKGNLEREGVKYGSKTNEEIRNLLKESNPNQTYSDEAITNFKKRGDEVAKLAQYSNPSAHFRMIREEVKQAALDGKTKLQFPTGETAMKIEGLGENVRFVGQEGDPITATEGVEVGQEVHGNGNVWVVTDVLGDGKFKAVPHETLMNMEEELSPLGYDSPDSIDFSDPKVQEALSQQYAGPETFDISGKVDTENPIYKFYDKEVGKYLKSKYGAERITDPQGQSWWEVPLTEEHANNPVEAYGAGLGFGQGDDDEKKRPTYNPFMAVAGVAMAKFFGPEFKGITGLALTEVAESADAAFIKQVLMRIGMREGAADILAPKLVGANTPEKVNKVVWGEPEYKKSDKTPTQLPSEDESYQIMADQHLQTEPYLKASQTEEEALIDNLTSVFKDMKGVDQEILDAKVTDEDLEQARQHYEFLQDALLDHPGRALMKYVSRETGQLPELKGKNYHALSGEKNLNVGKWAQEGDRIFMDLVGYEKSNAGDMDAAQELVDQYRAMREQLAGVQQNLRTARTTIRTQKLKNQFIESSKRAIARNLVKDVTTLKNMVQAAERAGFVKGVAAGNKKVQSIVSRIKNRRFQILALQKSNNLSDKQMKEVTRNMDWRLIPGDEFESWLHTVNERAAIEHHKNVTKQIIGALIEDSNLKNPDNLRVAMDLPVLSKMDLAQLQEYENALSQYKKGDSFVGPRMIVTLENTDLSGAKTWREIKQKLAEQTGTEFSELTDVRGSEMDKFTYDQALAERNPLYKYMVTQYASKEVENAQKINEINKNLDKLAKAARASRGRTKVDKLVPQDKEVFGWLKTAESEKAAYASVKKMTPQELEYARYVQALYQGWRDILIEKGTLKKWRESYITHTNRSFLERWLEDSKEEGSWKGFVKSIIGSWKQFTEARVDFPAVGDTGTVLGLEKFFKYSLPRGKEVIPSKNVARVVLSYARTFYKKDALDQIIPKIEAYTMALQREPGPGIPKDPTGLNIDGELKEFIKQWLNNKKGRRLNNLGANQGGKIDTVIRITNFVVTMHDLGFNLIAQPISVLGEVGANFIGMDLPEFAIGAKRLFTKEGREIAEKYPGVVGELPLERLINVANDVGDTFMAGAYYIFQEASYRAKQQFFLGLLTPTEYKSGIVSIERQALIKNEMGKYRPLEGSESVVGSTQLGKAVTKYKAWAVPLVSSAYRDAKKVISLLKAAEGMNGAEKAATSKEARRLLKLLVSGVGGYLLVSWIFGNKTQDKSLAGKIKNKIQQEIASGIGSLDPTFWFSTPRALTFVASLAVDLKSIAFLEKYASNGPGYEKGDLKGLHSLGKDLVPAFMNQFIPAPKAKTTSSSSSSSSGSKNPALKRLQALKKAKSKTNPALDRLKKLKKQSSTLNPALRRLKALKGN